MSDKVKKLYVRNSEEQNRKVLESAMNKTENMVELREAMLRACKLDILDKKAFPVSDPNFSFAAAKKKMREAVGIAGFPQLARAGVQVAFNNAVMAYADTTYAKWVHVINSDKDTELYAPLHGISFLQERGPTGKFVESSVAGLDISLKNREFGQILSIDQNMLADDQTGQLAQLASDLAEWTELLKEVWCYGKLASVSGANYAGLSIPSSETKPANEANFPYAGAAAPFVGGGFNKPASFGALTQPNIQAGHIALLAQKNLLGLKMAVNPKLLTVSPYYQFDSMILMQSTLNPSTTPSAAQAVGGAYSVNPIKSLYEVNVSRFIFDNTGNANGNAKAWHLMDNSKPWFVLQLRQPGSVVQENPESGESFDRKVVRHRLDIRMNADIIDPRFMWQGSDGSA
jgi:phage major head subunit gpT-like protein